jgi:hypothetical protein
MRSKEAEQNLRRHLLTLALGDGYAPANPDIAEGLRDELALLARNAWALLDTLREEGFHHA